MSLPEFKNLNIVPYAKSLAMMQEFAAISGAESNSEVWFVEHPPVYTLGTACDLSTLVTTDIPVVKTDRGGQITYHGPGQIVMYVLLNLKSYKLGVKALVECLEQIIIDVLSSYGIEGERRKGAPGVYVDDKKIAALGLRVKRGWSYHGLSFNVNMDLTPFSNIDPCGYKGLEVTQLSDYVTGITSGMIAGKLKGLLTNFLKHQISELEA